jgi:hypothetical protein
MGTSSSRVQTRGAGSSTTSATTGSSSASSLLPGMGRRDSQEENKALIGHSVDFIAKLHDMYVNQPALVAEKHHHQYCASKSTLRASTRNRELIGGVNPLVRTSTRMM